MRKQYHVRPGVAGGLDAWDVDRLIELVSDQAVEELPLDAVSEIDSDYWFNHGYTPTVRAVADHFRLMTEADLSYPIVIGPDGRVMDGMHRVARALAEGRTSLPAKRPLTMPEPDFRDVHPDELPY